MIIKAQLPPKRGYVERVNPITREHYYHRTYKKVGCKKQRIVINTSGQFMCPNRATNFSITLVGGGSSSYSDFSSGNGKIITKNINLEPYHLYNITIGKAGVDGHAGEPTSFGDYLVALGGQPGDPENTEPFSEDGLLYGMGETADHPATDGICIIEYDEVIYE